MSYLMLHAHKILKQKKIGYKNTNTPAATNCPVSDLFFQPKKLLIFVLN